MTDPVGLECNANVVAPNLLLTARHCVGILDKTQPVSCSIGSAVFASPTVTGDYAASHFSVWHDAALTKPYGGIHATQIIDMGASTLCGADLAFVVLDQPLTDLPIVRYRTIQLPWGIHSPWWAREKPTMRVRSRLNACSAPASP